GLATPDPARRLAVMTDSHTGAFGVMAAIGVLGLKFVALADLDTLRWFGLMAAAGWGRWGQVVAIARYPYLKATGKGALHKAHAHPRTDWLWGMALLVGLSGVALSQEPHPWGVILGAMGGGGAISLLSGAWLQRQLGGHTGDTYGAIVEWTEALFLCGLVGCAQFL
ncbi:MAG TPA: adenosylcobinamide-GDP ribazoletransferase, partial [Candidatus Obscuribacterales bacterium]